MGAVFQDIGAMVCLNETAWAVGWCGISGAKLLKLPSEKYAQVRSVTIDLLVSVGGITILKSEEIQRDLRQKVAESLLKESDDT